MTEHEARLPEWSTDELVPACRCQHFRIKTGETVVPGEGKLVECDNCGNFERVYREPGLVERWHIGMMASMVELRDKHGIEVPLLRVPEGEFEA